MVETVSISEETVDTHKTEADSFSDSEDTSVNKRQTDFVTLGDVTLQE